MAVLLRPLTILVAAMAAQVLLVGCGSRAQSANSEAIVANERHFALKVWPLLQAKCIACHGDDPSDVKGGLDMTSLAGLRSGGESGEPAVVPGDSEASLLISAVHRDQLAMPPKDEDRLSPDQIVVLEQWVNDGAHWPTDAKQAAIKQAAWQSVSNAEGTIVKTSGGLSEDWTYRRYEPENLWAYQPVAKPVIEVQERNPVDVFVDAELEKQGLTAAPQAVPLTLIRRVTFDVIGLPPTVDEIEDFIDAWNVDRQQAWEDLVDRLLASPHYGEAAALQWLDVVRYADSSGFANDWQRPNAWRYRDYVVRSFNQDKPYDKFVREQVAGDELNPHDPEMKIALGFLRMGPWEHSSMSVAKVSRQQFLDDVTDAVGQVFLAHPLQCARCHDHKFDPIPTRDYYAMQAVFATTQLADVAAEWLPEENRAGMETDRQVHAEKREWNRAIFEQLQEKIASEETKWYRERGLPYKSRDEAIEAGAESDQIPEYRVGLSSDEIGRVTIGRNWNMRFAWETNRYEPVALSVYSGKTRLPSSVHKPTKQPRDPFAAGELEETSILAGGDPFSPVARVAPGVLSIADAEASFKITEQPTGRRLALADWLVSPENPLTARVMVNRVWQSHFGRGIVSTPNNFGAMGEKPTHPELLDFLAATFVENGWSIKNIRRMILTSDAYRRASHHPDWNADHDVETQRELYAVFVPRRLVAEELRDAMLAASGELNPRLGGIPVRPDINMEVALQPRLVMGTIAPAYVPSPKPEQRNRRSIYALKLRGLRDPFMEVFNQPSPDIPCELRDESNITPQVFSLLNSQESADRSLALAKHVLDEADADEAAIERLYWLVFGRGPSDGESEAAIKHWHDMQEIQAQIRFEPHDYPSKVVRKANEEISGQLFEFVERLFGYDDYVPDLQPHKVDARTRGLADVCLMMLNSNEFVYVY